MNFDESIIRAREMINNCKNPIVFFDKDSDGSMSYLQLRKTFSQIKVGFPLGKEDDSQNEGMNEIFDEYDLIIFFDTPFVKSEFFEVIGDRQVLWVDHHKRYNDEILEKYSNVFFLNPLDFNKYDSRCSSYIAYLICDDELNLKYSVLGSVGDFYLLDVFVKLYEKDRDSFNALFKITDSLREEIFDFVSKYSYLEMEDSVYLKRREYIQKLWYDCDFILFKFFFDVMYKLDDSRMCFRALKQIEKMSLAEFRLELLEGKVGIFEKFSRVYKEYKEVFEKISKNVVEGEIVHLEHSNTIISYNRQLSEEFAYRLKKSDVLFLSYTKDDRDIVSGSFRSREFDVASLIARSLKGLEGQGGGHVNSAGFIVKKSDFETFKNRVMKEFEK